VRKEHVYAAVKECARYPKIIMIKLRPKCQWGPQSLENADFTCDILSFTTTPKKQGPLQKASTHLPQMTESLCRFSQCNDERTVCLSHPFSTLLLSGFVVYEFVQEKFNVRRRNSASITSSWSSSLKTVPCVFHAVRTALAPKTRICHESCLLLRKTP